MLTVFDVDVKGILNRRLSRMALSFESKSKASEASWAVMLIALTASEASGCCCESDCNVINYISHLFKLS